MSANQRGSLPKSPAELAGLVFDVPCLACGKNVFTVPYVADVHHVLTCPACKAETWVLIDEVGGIKYFERDVALEKIKRAENAATLPSPASHAFYQRIRSQVVKSGLVITWGYTIIDSGQIHHTATSTVDWTSA
jgi:hypothetical protein